MSALQTCKAVIFDLYGTLIRYLPSEEYRQCHLDTAEALGVPSEQMRGIWDASIGRRLTGDFPVFEECLELVCHELGHEVEPEQIRRAAEVRLRMLRRNLYPRDGAVELLSELRAAGYRMGVISDCVPEIPRLWPETPFAALIDAPVFSCQVGVTKPDRRIYEIACERLGVSAPECLYVGDGGSHELTGARAAGMHPLLLLVEDEGAHTPSRPDLALWDGPQIGRLQEILQILGPSPS